MRVALFVTCLIDTMRPQAAFASIQLLEQAGCEVEVPEQQTCCGQPAYNNGDMDNARQLARHTIDSLQGYDYIVIPSGSCAGMMIHHYPRLFTDEPEWLAKAEALASCSYELTQFLHDVVKFETSVTCPQTLTYHDSCSCKRELGVEQQPRQLLSRLDGLVLNEMEETEVCCGFGGTFAVTYPEISAQMVGNKTSNIKASGAQLLAAADLGCLLNIAGKLSREQSPVRAFHIAEVLAGLTDKAAIGEED
ncbi:MAG: (Fe-S)-binding protein [Gammaproteobacteria bacterium]|nr:(Fe-S)-binding protein [Gammaproteobacteria bacterium]